MTFLAQAVLYLHSEQRRREKGLVQIEKCTIALIPCILGALIEEACRRLVYETVPVQPGLGEEVIVDIARPTSCR
jgi:hypothetical protein